MHKKINMDYIKSKIPQMPAMPPMHLPNLPKNLPKIRSRKVFSTKENIETLSVPPISHSTVIDRSPSRISTITSLVEGQYYDYRLEEAQVPGIDNRRHEHEQHSSAENPSSKRFTQQITKRYKELSEMKFKNFFGKKTIVRKTEIQVDMYKETVKEEREEQKSLHSEYEFEFRSLPQESTYPESEESYPNSPHIGKTLSAQPASIPLAGKSESAHAIAEPKRNESSLWKIKSIKNKLRSASVESQQNETETFAESRKSSRRIAFDKAKKNMNANFHKLMSMSRSSISQDTVPDKSIEEKCAETSQKCNMQQQSLHSIGTNKKKGDGIEEVYGKVKRDSNESLENLYNSSTEMRRRNWARRRFLSNSTDSSDSPHCFKNSFDNNPPEVIITRPAPPIPPQKGPYPIPKWPPCIQLATDSYKDGSPIRRRNFFSEFPLKGHSRKPSMDSLDSDSWIPETFKYMAKPQSELNIIDENTEAWEIINTPINRLQKTQSIDIFTSETDDAFDNFDDYLMNEPVVSTSFSKASKHFHHQPPPPPKPLVKQASITRQFSDELADLNTDVNRLISRFEPNPILTRSARSEKIQVTAVVEIKRGANNDTDSSDEQEAAKVIVSTNEQQEKQKNIIAPEPNPEVAKAGKDQQQRPRPKLQRSKPSEDLALAATIQDSDETFYSFEEDEEVHLHISQRKVRHVYSIDL